LHWSPCTSRTGRGSARAEPRAVLWTSGPPCASRPHQHLPDMIQREAASCYQRALSIVERCFPPERPTTRAIRHDLARTGWPAAAPVPRRAPRPARPEPVPPAGTKGEARGPAGLGGGGGAPPPPATGRPVLRVVSRRHR